MQMNDIIDGLNTCDFPAGPPVCPGGIGGFTGGCGFGSWIWILLILFYSNQGGYGRHPGMDKCCCVKEDRGFGCHGYLFLLVILFLCNGCNVGGSVCGGFDQGFDGAFGGIC